MLKNTFRKLFAEPQRVDKRLGSRQSRALERSILRYVSTGAQTITTKMSVCRHAGRHF